MVAELYPWPALDGYRRRLHHVVAGLAAAGEVDVLTPWRSGDTPPASPPIPSVEGADAVPTAADEGARAWIGKWVSGSAPRRLLGVDWSGVVDSLEGRNLDDYDLIWCSHVDTWWPLREHLAGRRVIVDFDNLENLALKLRRRIPPRTTPGAGPVGAVRTWLRWGTSRAFDVVDERRWDRLQHDCAAAVNHVVVCSDLDAERSGVSNVAVVPNGADVPDRARAIRTELMGAEPTLNFIGALDYEPNTEAVEWLVREIVPRIRARRPDVVTRIVGRGEQKVAWVANVPGVKLVGAVDDIAEELAAADVSIVPIQVGAGTRLKVVEALANHLPLVTTTLGCEGIAVEHGVSALIADDADSFAEACVRLIEDADLRQQLADAGAKLFEDHYTWESIEQRVIRLAQSTART